MLISKPTKILPQRKQTRKGAIASRSFVSTGPAIELDGYSWPVWQ